MHKQFRHICPCFSTTLLFPAICRIASLKDFPLKRLFYRSRRVCLQLFAIPASRSAKEQGVMGRLSVYDHSRNSGAQLFCLSAYQAWPRSRCKNLTGNACIGLQTFFFDNPFQQSAQLKGFICQNFKINGPFPFSSV